MSGFDRFTERARTVLSLAQEEAQRFQHNYIGTEHLLLGLVREGEGVAARALTGLGVELNKIRSAVEFIIGRGERIVLGEIGLTPRSKTVIELAVDEARLLNHHYIGTEHLLLGMVREGQGIAAGVLESLGVNLEKVRSEVLKLLAPPPEKPQGAEPQSEQIQRVIALAREEAHSLRHTMVRTEHLLLGLLRQHTSDAASTLQRLGVSHMDVRTTVEFVLGYGMERLSGELALSPMAQKVLEATAREARDLQQEKASALHLLVGLIHHEECVGAGLLELLGVDLVDARAQALRALKGEGEQPVARQEVEWPWRTAPEIDTERQRYLTRCLRVNETPAELDTLEASLARVLQDKAQAITDHAYERAAELREREVRLREDISRLEARRTPEQPAQDGTAYPFQGVILNRADVEWLLIAHQHGRGPVDWHEAQWQKREGLDLRGAHLQGADLRHLPLTRLRGGKEWTAAAGIHLEGADLQGAHLEGALLFWAHLERANLANAYLQGANLTAAHLQEANCSGAFLQGASLSEAHLERANLSAAHLERANLCWAFLDGANLQEASLTEANLRQASLQDVDLSKTRR